MFYVAAMMFLPSLHVTCLLLASLFDLPCLHCWPTCLSAEVPSLASGTHRPVPHSFGSGAPGTSNEERKLAMLNLLTPMGESVTFKKMLKRQALHPKPFRGLFSLFSVCWNVRVVRVVRAQTKLLLNSNPLALALPWLTAQAPSRSTLASLIALQAVEAEEQEAKDRVKASESNGFQDSNPTGPTETPVPGAPTKQRRLSATSTQDVDAAVRTMQENKRDKQDKKAQKQLKKTLKKRKAGDVEEALMPATDVDMEDMDNYSAGSVAAPSGVVTGKDGLKTRGASEATGFTTRLKATGSGSEEREKCALDDFLSALTFARTNLPYAVSDKEFNRTKEFLVSLFLELCWTTSVAVNGKAFKVYSKFRQECERLVYAAHQEKINFGEKQFNPLALASNLLELCKAPARGLIAHKGSQLACGCGKHVVLIIS